jgi:hypothetical protein
VNIPKSKLSLIEAFTGLHAIPGKVTDTPWIVEKFDVSFAIDGFYQDMLGGDMKIERSGNKLKSNSFNCSWPYCSYRRYRGISD